MKFYSLIAIIAFTIFGCKDGANKTEDNFTYLGGEIIAPINDVVILSNSNKIIDTLKLNSKNRFLYKFEDFEPGIYSFSLQAADGLEFQMVLLESNDSIMLRLNTLDFDESLVYTGLGAKKNNYLINEFLQNEVEEKKVFKYCRLDPKAFESKIDSLKELKLKKFNAFKSKFTTSELFDKLAISNIDYNHYNSKEIYPIIHYRNNKNSILESLPEDFYSYRKNIDYNDEFLKDHYNYRNFLTNNFNNLAIKTHLDHNNNERFNRWSLCYNLDRLVLIDSLVSNSKTKNNLLHQYVVDYISKSKNIENNEAILDYYLSKSTNEKHKESVSSYVTSISNLKIGDVFPKVSIVNYKGEVLNVNSLITSATVVSFWSHKHYDHFKESHYKINELKIKYPEVKFISINVDECGLKTSSKSLKVNHFTFNNEYQFKNPEQSIKTLAIQPMTKTIIIDKYKRIVNSNTNIFSMNFEEQLLGLINR